MKRSHSRGGVDPYFVAGFAGLLLSAAIFAYVLRRPTGPRPSDLAKTGVPTTFFKAYDTLGLSRVRGSATAPDTLLEITDFLCPSCGAAQRILGKTIDSLVSAGALVHRVIEVPFQNGSLAVSVSAACVWEADRDAYWRYRSVLFDAQRSVAAAYPVTPELVRLAQFASFRDSTALRRCIEQRGTALSARLTLGVDAAVAAKIAFTPVFSLNGHVLPPRDLSLALSQPRQLRAR